MTVINLADFRKPENLDAPASVKDKAKFALDTVADQWANDLVHGLMVKFHEGGEVDASDPIYHKLMKGLADITRSMTRHHLGVFDISAAMLQKYPDAEVSVGVFEFKEEDDG